MILPFSTQLNGKPTYFVERIHKCFSLKEIYMIAGLDPSVHYPKDYNFVAKDKLSPKLHTIREDKNDRWKAGTKIDFFINCRQPNMFRFAPVLPVVSVQKIEIVYYSTRETIIKDLPSKRAVIIDDKKRLSDKEIQALAQNDGFDSLDDFFAYFENGFTGKLIHWTDLKY
jgi:hypothetical protein